MKTVKDIYDFFHQFPDKDKNSASLMEFLETIPVFSETVSSEKGMSSINMSIGKEYLKICEQMEDDNLLIKVKEASILKIDPQYIAVDKVNFSNPEEFIQELDYGVYDFKYRGFAYTRSCFENSVLPIVGKNRITGDEDMGTCYYIGNNLFVTAAHCVKGLKYFNILCPDNSPVELESVWYTKGEDLNDYDLAIIKSKNVPMDIKAFKLKDPFILNDVLTMGYPLIPGLNPVLISETATVASYVYGRQKASIGQIVAEVGSYMSKLDFFVITARVKGGNSGCPVINNEGCVVGTVFQIPFDSQGGSDGGRYDIMGYGICLPSKYVNALIKNRDIHQLVLKGEYYAELA